MPFASWQLSRPLRLCLGAAIGVVVITQTLRWVSRRKPSQKRPPTAPYSPWFIVKQYHGTNVPLFDLELARKLQSPAIRLPLPFGHEMYLIVDHNLALQILQDPKNDKADTLKVFNLVNGGLPSIVTLLTKSPKLRPRRKAISHAMAPVKLNKKVHFMENKLKDLFNILEKAAKDSIPVDIASLLIRLTLDILSLSLFDYDLHAISGDHTSEGCQFYEMFELAATECQKQTIDPLRAWKFWDAEMKTAKQASKWILDLGLRIINHYRCNHTAEDIKGDESLLANLIRSDVYSDDADRASDMAILLIAGFSSAQTLAWTLYEISKHPDIQEALQAEVDQLSDPPTLSQLSQSSLLNCCLKESMRLWPVAGEASFRHIHADIEVNGMVIPKNASIITSYHAIFRQATSEYPDEFRPERWLNPSPDLEASLIPFSAGPRGCAGQNLATLELRVVLAHVMRRFSFSVARHPEYQFLFISKPQGLLLHVNERM